MDRLESLGHSVCECKYHVVFIPKCRRKTLYGELRHLASLGQVFRRLATQNLVRAADFEDQPAGCSEPDRGRAHRRRE